MTEKEIDYEINKIKCTYQILQSIDFFNRYKAISDKYNVPLDLFKTLPDVKQFKSIMLELGYKVKHTSRYLYFVEKINNGENLFKFNIGRYTWGKCELHVYLNDKNDNNILGDVFVGLYKTKEMVFNNDYNKVNIISPRFHSYQEFQQIMQEFLPLYEDMKQAFIDSGIRTKEDIANYFKE